MPISKRSSASGGVMPKPAAEFSPLASMRSIACSFTRDESRSLTMVRPGLPKMSPIKRMRMIVFRRRHRRLTEEIEYPIEASMLPRENARPFARRGRARPPVLHASRNQFCCFKKVVIAGRIQGQVLHTLVVNHYVVEVPQVDVRQILGEDSLNLRVDLLACVLVRFAAGLLDERIQTRAGVIGAIGAIGGEFGRVEDVSKDVGIFVASDPAQGVQLIRSSDDIGKESGEFESANVEGDANFAQLLLQCGGHQPRALIG